MTRATVLTPAGVAAVAVIVLEAVPDDSVGLVDRRGQRLAWPAPGRFRRARLRLDGRDVDDVLVVGREPGAELHVHGGTAVVQAVLKGLDPGRNKSGTVPGPSCVVASSGLRAARARASVLHGTLHDLARAVTDGGSGDELLETIHSVIANVQLAHRLERPATVRIVGLPNVGKSTLFNALLMEDRALVSPSAGTTRDPVTALTQLNGVAVRLEDTEGGAEDEACRPGADLLLHVLSAPGEPSPRRRPAEVLLIRVLGKVDGSQDGGPPGVSGKTGFGVDALRARIVAVLGASGDVRDDVLTPVDPDLRRVLRQAAAGVVFHPALSGAADSLRQGRDGPQRVSWAESGPSAHL